MAEYTLSEERKKQFASIYLLDKMVNKGMKFSVLLEGYDKDLEPILEHMMAHDYVDIQNNRYQASDKGREVLRRFMTRYSDYLRHFDVYCAVDLESGEFAFDKWFEFESDEAWDRYLDEERWEDLRVAVSEYKELDPVEIVFMSFLNEGRFGDVGNGWQFDLLLGSVWDEIIEICQSALHEDDLAYTDEDGTPVSGSDVLEDIIEQGADMNLWVREEEERLEKEEGYDPDEYNDEHGFGRTDMPSLKDRVVVQRQTDWSGYQNYKKPKYVNPIWRNRVFF